MADVYGGGLHLPMDLLVDLAGSRLRLMLYGTRVFYGGAVFVHLAAMGVFFGLIVVMALQILRLDPSPEPRLPGIVQRRILTTSFVITLISGVLLFLYDPIGVGLHTMFVPKLLLIVAGYALARTLRRIGRTRFGQGAAAASLAVWTLVIACSAWNHAERPVYSNRAALSAERPAQLAALPVGDRR